MSKQPFFQRRWKLILNIVTLAFLAVLLYAIRDQVAETIQNFKYVNGWVLLLIFPVQFLNYHGQTKLYQTLFNVVGNKLSYKYLFRASLELNFVNHVFPSGGVTGISYFALRMRQGDKLTGSKASLIQVMKLMLTFLSFEVLLILGLLVLAAAGKASNMTILVAGSLSTLLIVGTLMFAYIVGSKSRIKAFFTLVTRALNRFIYFFKSKKPEAIKIDSVHRTFDEFHEHYNTIRQNRKKLKAPFMYALLMNLTEVMSVYIVYIAFGEWINIGAIILAYAVANFAGLVSVLPGGIGIYEALMTAVLVSAGVPAGVSLPVTIMYRMISTAIQVPPGYYFYQKTLRESSKKPHAA